MEPIKRKSRLTKWLIALIIIFIISFISCAVLAGHVYYQDLKTYTDYDKQELKVEALKNIYIKSCVPIDIYPTTGKPYVEFNQSFIDLVGIAPKYTLNVEAKENSTYITLDELQDIILYLGIKENKARLSIYLPQLAIDTLNIQNQVFFYGDKKDQMIDLSKMDIKDLTMKVNTADITLQGTYENVNLRMQHQGKLNMYSKNPCQLYVEGNVEQTLKGKFDKITIKDNTGDINMESMLANSIQINSTSSNIRFEGQSERIYLTGDSNNVDLYTNAKTKLTTKGVNNYINGTGAFTEIVLGEDCSEITLQNNMIPEKIQLTNCTNATNVSLTLPSNIPGFTIRYIGNEKKLNKNEYEVYESYLMDEKYIQSDFKVKSSISARNELLYTFGDGSIPISMGEEDVMLEIIDGGYQSVK